MGSPAEAELVKLLENTFRHVNIALVNELAMFAGDLNVDIWRAIDAASTKPFGYMRFTPGPGRGRALPAGRPVLPLVAGTPTVRPVVPVRRARQRRQRAHARLRRAPHHRAAERALARGARHEDPAARDRVQGRDLGLARVAVDRGGGAARRARRRPAGVRPAHPGGAAHRPAPRARGLHPGVAAATPISSCCSSTTPSSTPTRSAGTRRSCSTRRASCAAGPFDGETL